jgi:hypothetical protein
VIKWFLKLQAVSAVSGDDIWAVGVYKNEYT